MEDLHMDDNIPTGLSPVKSYTAPKLPTLSETRNDPALLKKLPSRWKKKAAVLACMALVGSVTLASCDYYSLGLHEQSEITQLQLEAALEAAELNIRTHTGGSGFGPFYVAHITEQEAFGIIRAQLEAAGLNFGATPPGYTVDKWAADFGIDLFDARNNVGISHISWADNNIAFFSHGGNWLAEEVAEAFAQQTDDISVGVFFNPGKFLGMTANAWDRDENEEHQPPTEEAKEEAKVYLVENITAQVRDFIKLLHAQGVI